MDAPKPGPTPNALSLPVTALRGVGPERSAQLSRLGVRTVEELLLLRPRRYEDRRQILSIRGLELHQSATVRGRIVALGVKRFQRGRKSVFEFILEDGTARLHCRWWNLPYMQQYFKQGDELLVFGKPISLAPRTMDHPETEVIDAEAESSIHLNRIAPVYPLTEGLPQRWLRSLIWRTLEEKGADVAERWSPSLTPEMLTRGQAIQELHFPSRVDGPEKARQKLALDELLDLQASLAQRRQALLSHARGRPCPGDNSLIKPFLARLGFSLTKAQVAVLRELRADLASGRPMRRLLQGDVGAGKTVVAACCALLAIESGYAVALMAPTEILAQQHHRTFTSWFECLEIPVYLHTGSKKSLNDQEGRARPAVVVGTHALIESSFALEELGLVIIDEQHRFGVTQREALVRKGEYPHLLILTATPIPRTLGLTLYGDLDVSILEGLPPGRTPVRTFVRSAASLPKVLDFVRDKLKQGRQAYVVLPRIDETSAGVKAVKQEYDILQKELAPAQVGLLHGRLSAEQKEAVMASFRQGTIQVLLSTSLIEVGIDVSNATVMVIENAEQFGLAQLHQLRGRIGRGAHESYCILLAHTKTAEAAQRLKLFAETADGFRIAEADLALRGPGDFLGQQQSGLPPLSFADLVKDAPLVERARALVKNSVFPAQKLSG